MARPHEAHIEVARRLLARASSEAGTPEGPEAVRGVHAALFQSLAPVIGAAGFRALFDRSVKLAKAEYPSLDAARTLDDSGADIENPVMAQVLRSFGTLEPASAREAAVGLFATFYALVATFIGESLVQRLVEGANPAVDELVPEVKE